MQRSTKVGVAVRGTRWMVAALALIAASTASAAAGSAAGQTDTAATAVRSALERGKNYADARAPARVDVDDVLARARGREAAMNAGKNYADAWGMPSADPASLENARRHELAMNRGLDHEDARSASVAR